MFEEIFDHESIGKEYHYNGIDGKEHWVRFNSTGNKICSKDSDGIEIYRERDSNGKLLYVKIYFNKDSHEYEEWNEYDSNGNKIHLKDSNGNEEWYDSNGKEIH